MSRFQFPPNIKWLNTTKSYNIDDFKGHLVLLDFWTYCCINCIHTIPSLKQMEEEFPELIIIGIHSGKFLSEADDNNILEAIERHEIKHPVINDSSFEIWKKLNVSAWPTFVLLNFDGEIVGTMSGEGVYEVVTPYIKQLYKNFEDKMEKKRFPFEYLQFEPKQTLYFPAKIEVDTVDNLLFIADTNNNRIIISKENGEVIDVIGGSNSGLQDGDFQSVLFHSPQGMAFDKTNAKLYIADTGNHCIRVADLRKRYVTTLLGKTSKQKYFSRTTAKNEPIVSPWDIALNNNILYIANAGTHQILGYDLENNSVFVFAGNASENLLDGVVQKAKLAQPSGICVENNIVYFADSETSAIRMVNNNYVKTLIGKGLFNFGDVNGTLQTALLQHPLGITYYHQNLYIADTYNNKIKKYSFALNSVSTFCGTGESGEEDGAANTATFNEPNDLAVLNNKLYIADTNNHKIRVVCFETNNVSTLQLKFL